MRPNIHILGIQGSGKGTQSALLTEKYNLNYISTGSLFRSRSAQSDSLGIYLKEEMKTGNLIPDHYLIQIVEEYLTKNPIQNGFLGDGVIRTTAQYTDLMPVWKKFDLESPLLIHLDLSESVATLRIEKRIKESGEARRADDHPAAIALRFQAYYTSTAPVIHLFEQAHRCIHVDANQTISTIHQEICQAISGFYPSLTHGSH